MGSDFRVSNLNFSFRFTNKLIDSLITPNKLIDFAFWLLVSLKGRESKAQKN